MKRAPATLEPAAIDFDEEGVPRSLTYGDGYHPREGAPGQARHVFLAGNGLPRRWQGRRDFTILETGFGLGHNFLATWAAWREDPLRCRRLHLVSVEAHPVRREDLARAHAATPWPDEAAALQAAWPEARPGLHLLEFEAGAVRLWLALGEAEHWLPRLRLRADAFFLDGFAPSRNPQMWSPQVFRSLSRLAAAQATAATWSAARVVREGLAQAGFEVHAATGFGHKRDMSIALYAPRRSTLLAARHVLAWPAAAPPLRAAPTSPGGHALVIGAGLAGAAAAAALARVGWRCTVLERHAQPALEASGNPAGIFHAGSASGGHRHAELLAQAAHRAAGHYRRLIEDARVQGAADGLRHGEQRDPSGGWIAPRALVAHWLASPGVALQPGCAVHALSHDCSTWVALGRDGNALAPAGDIVVIAGGTSLPALLQASGAQAPAARLVRGQLSWVETPAALDRPVAGHGYALRVPGGPLLFGATSHPDDLEPALRPGDHDWNVQRLRALTGIVLPAETPWQGRVGWRCQAA
ncbi:MAG: tRNA (5-methylaminomethyl-2-thiouridine)(34)-methyltransferase MnmD, partial [Rubrivivax sp.]